jgi:hypothetical protein
MGAGVDEPIDGSEPAMMGLVALDVAPNFHMPGATSLL